MVSELIGALDVEFEAFYRAEVLGLSALAASLTGDRDLGADLADEAMLRAFRRWDRVRGLARPGAWVRRVLINLAIDAHRRRVREGRALARLGSKEPVTTEPGDGAEEFWVAVRALPERQRSAVALRYVNDLAIEEIAQVLGVTTGTVKATLHAARCALGTDARRRRGRAYRCGQLRIWVDQRAPRCDEVSRLVHTLRNASPCFGRQQRTSS